MKNIKRLNDERFSQRVLEILLTDFTTKKHIYYANTDDSHSFTEPLTINSNPVSRVLKTNSDKTNRKKKMAEVFTPVWTINKMLNSIEESSGFKNSFTVGEDKNYKCCDDYKQMSGDELANYLKFTYLEITCGEAPFITTRYDTISGEDVPLEDRVGILDRKFKILNLVGKSDPVLYFRLAVSTIKSVYGFDYQGDSLFLARKNVLLTFIENFVDTFNVYPPEIILVNIAIIIQRNFWQMDGILYTLPFESDKRLKDKMKTKYPDELYCKIYDWQNRKEIYFKDMVKNNE